MNVTELEQLVNLVESANIHELTLKHNGARVTIRKSPAGFKSTSIEPLADAMPDAETFADEETLEEDNLPETDGAIPVTSPLVGTFRTAKHPIELGALVKAGQVIGIIEAMKLPNEVPAPCAGKVVELFVEAGQFVEYGQPLFALEPEN